MGNPSFVDMNVKHAGLLFNLHGFGNDILKKKKRKSGSFIGFTWPAITSDLSFGTTVCVRYISKHRVLSQRTFLK